MEFRTESGSEQGNNVGLRRLLPQDRLTWPVLVAGILAIVFAVNRLAISMFFYPLGVSPEEVGVSSTAIAVERSVLILGGSSIAAAAIVYLYIRWQLAGWWLEVRAKARSLRTGGGKRKMVWWLLHRAVVWASVVAFLAVMPAVADRDVSLRLPGDSDLVVVVPVGFILLWIALAYANRKLVLGVKPPQPAPQWYVKWEKKRLAARLTGWSFPALVAIQLVILLVSADHQAREVSAGHGIGGGLFPPTYPATVRWIGEPNAALAQASDHCLMYLGQAAGTAVLFDVDDQTTVRLPTRDVIIAAATGGSHGTTTTSPCHR